ncbi:MAG: AmmeMemoRadiSam system protein B [Bacteroidales bacterium]|jgi:AmmeMemoRadiSam system protein B|nr:AmmeMemoRadiSam system protein B [Bacteroidales bacterium]
MRPLTLLLLICTMTLASCRNNQPDDSEKIRTVVDTIGFTTYAWQMDSIVSRLDWSKGRDNTWRVAITPHDDYTYVGNLYPEVLNGVRAKIVVLFGVAHKARSLGLEDRLIFDSHDAWSAPYGNVRVSDIRRDILERLPDSLYMVNDEMHAMEHSLEALIPFLQHNNRNIEIVPVLVPAMTFERMRLTAAPFAAALGEIMDGSHLEWGSDIAIVITTDAVHYGDEEWGGSNYAPYGTDEEGTAMARAHEMEIIDSCLKGSLKPERLKRFVEYTVQGFDHREYKWTWCGRYAVPFGLLMSHELSKITGGEDLYGTFIGYASSIDHPRIKVDDLGMGITAPAYSHHWVGYAALGFR